MVGSGCGGLLIHMTWSVLFLVWVVLALAVQLVTVSESQSVLFLISFHIRKGNVPCGLDCPAGLRRQPIAQRHTEA